VASASVTSASARERLKNLTSRLDKPSIYVVYLHPDPPPFFTQIAEPDSKSGTANLKFARSYSLQRGTDLRSAALDAFKSEDESDSEVHFVLFAVSKDGKKEEELGTARVSLEAMLDTGVDLQNAKMQVMIIHIYMCVGVYIYICIYIHIADTGARHGACFIGGDAGRWDRPAKRQDAGLEVYIYIYIYMYIYTYRRYRSSARRVFHWRRCWTVGPTCKTPRCRS